MKISVEKDGDTAILDVAGTVNIKSSPQLHDAIKNQVEAGSRRILVRLAGVEYMDSSGVGVLVSGMRLASAKGVAYGLVELAPRVNLVIEMTRLADVFQIFPDIATAKQQPG